MGASLVGRPTVATSGESARGVFRGAGLIIVSINDKLREMSGDVEGLPAAEVWTDTNSSDVQAAMRATFADGMVRYVPGIRSVDGVIGTVLIAPLGEPRWGVATEWSPVALPPTVSGPLPDLDLARLVAG